MQRCFAKWIIVAAIPAMAGQQEELRRVEHLLQLDHTVEASRELTRLVESYPRNLAVLRTYASFLSTAERNPPAAEAVLKRITEVAPHDGDAWALLGTFYLDRERPEQGLECFEKAVEIDGGRAAYRAGLARALAANRRDAEAEEAFAVAARTASAPAAVFVWHGDYLATKGEHLRSCEAYTKALAATPRDPAVLLKRAGVAVSLGRFAEAQRDAEAARSAGAKERDVMNVLVRVYQGLGDEVRAAEAAVAVERAAQEEEDRRARWRRAKEALDRAEQSMAADRPSAALPDFELVNADAPEFAGAWLGTAVCKARLGDTAGAEAAFRAFLKLQPLSADGHAGLGLVLMSAGRTAEAREEFEEALRLDPNAEQAREALRALQE
jgi:tetratricopeptide (TPR) repeat protein